MMDCWQVEEAVEKVKQSVQMLKMFRDSFMEYKDKLPSYFPPDVTPRKWDFQEKLIFEKFDTFLERLKIIFEFCQTSNQFLRLEKVEVGGIRGKLLTDSMRKVFLQFKDLYATFALKTYDCSDPKNRRFLKDYERFNSEVWRMDRRLGVILVSAFDCCTNSDSIFKLLDVFGDLRHRRLIAMELSEKIPQLLDRINEELETARQIFRHSQHTIAETGRDRRAERNIPLAASQLTFSSQLRSRIRKTAKSLKNVNHPICYSLEAQVVFRKFERLNAQLCSYEMAVYDDWLSTAEERTKIGLEKPILVRVKCSDTLAVNFSRSALAVLTEVKFIKKLFPHKIIPEALVQIYQRFEEFRSLINVLESIVDLYNYLKTDTSDVDLRLIRADLTKLDQNLAPAEKSLTWNSANLVVEIENILEEVRELNRRVRETQDNVIEIYKEIRKFQNTPLFQRVKNR